MRFLLLLSLLPILVSALSTPATATGHRAGHASPAAAAPTPATATAPPQANLISVMSKKSCKLFAGLLTATPDVEKTFEDNVGSGLTVFCPVDAAVKAFTPKFKNLTDDGKVSLLLFHGIPVYNSLQMLKSGNGVVNTLATDGTSKNFNFTVQNEGEEVTLMSRGSKATISGTLLDDGTLAVYTIDEVLMPRELFKAAAAPAPAPAPARAADAPAADKGASSPPAPTPAGSEKEPADQKAADHSAGGMAARGGRWVLAAAVAAAVMGV